MNETATRIKGRVSTAAIAIITGILLLMISATFLSYSDFLVQKQQQEFLQLAHSVRYGIGMYLDGEKRCFAERDFFPADEDSLARFLLQNTDRRVQLLILDDRGSVIRESRSETADSFLAPDENTARALMETASRITDSEVLQGKAMQAAEHVYLIPLIRRLQGTGYVVEMICLSEIQDYLGSCMEDTEKGYAALKTQEGFIISHPNPDQIGLHMVEGRKKEYPELDLSYLEELEKRQLSGEEDTAVYDSYWFNEEPVRKSRKIATFTPIRLDSEFWVLTLNRDYQDYMAPLRNYVILTLALTSVLLFLIAALLILRRTAKEREERALLLNRHMKEIHESNERHMQELHESNERYLREREQRLRTLRIGQIGTMASKLAHDFRNFLHPVIGYAEFIEESEEASESIRDDAKKIIEYSEKAQELTRQLSKIGRNENIEMPREKMDLRALVLGFAEGTEHILPENVELRTELEEQPAFIMANPLKIEESVWNLCGNAIDAMKEKGGALTVRLRTIPSEQVPEKASVEPAALFADLEIEDTGTGMDEETMSKVFLQYFTTKKPGEGTGLGLAIVYNTVTELGGDVLVSSKVGEGTCFRCLIPLASE